MADIQTFKCVLVGNATVGKTTLIRRYLTNEFIETYSATHGVEINQLTFNTDDGLIRLNVWDCSGQEKYGEFSAAYNAQADCAIVMIDLSSRISFDDCFKWFARVKNSRDNIPIVLVGNKCDVAIRAVVPEDLYMFHEINIPYCEISAKTGYQIEKPFLKLIQILMHNVSR